MKVEGTYFFVGENSFQLHRDVRRWKEQFIAKHGPENLLQIEGKSQTVSSLSDAIGVMPFIAEKRLVVCEGLPKFVKGQLQDVLGELHPATILLFVESAPDKRLSTYKEAMELVQEVREFPELKGAKLQKWLEQEARVVGVILKTDIAKQLFDLVGDDQWMLLTELRKLALMGGGQITSELLESAVIPSGEQVVWKLTDLIGGAKSMEALQFLRRRLERGDDVYGMWVLLLSMVKNLSLVWSARAQGVPDQAIASHTGLHFLVVRSLLPLACTMNESQMYALVRQSMVADIALKTGGLKYKAEKPEEVIAVAEQLILSCAAK